MKEKFMNTIFYWILIVGLIGVGFLSLIPGFMLSMMFDAPNSNTLKNKILFFTGFSFSFICFFSAIASVIGFKFMHYEIAKYFLLGPIFNVLIAIIVIFLGYVQSMVGKFLER